MIVEGRAEVCGNFLCGVATHETYTDAAIDQMAATLSYSLEYHRTQPRNFLGMSIPQRASADEVRVDFANQSLNRIPKASLEPDASRIVFIISEGHLGGAVPHRVYLDERVCNRGGRNGRDSDVRGRN